MGMDTVGENFLPAVWPAVQSVREGDHASLFTHFTDLLCSSSCTQLDGMKSTKVVGRAGDTGGGSGLPPPPCSSHLRSYIIRPS